MGPTEVYKALTRPGVVVQALVWQKPADQGQSGEHSAPGTARAMEKDLVSKKS